MESKCVMFWRLDPQISMAHTHGAFSAKAIPYMHECQVVTSPLKDPLSAKWLQLHGRVVLNFIAAYQFMYEQH